MSLDLTRIPTPHIEAKKEDLADVVIMPGDPQRSKFIAEEYLSMPTLVNDIRGIQGYTGLYQGKRVTVMASGIGIPSISLYAYELYNFYDIDTIIRVGTAGSIDPRMRIGDLLFANTAYTDSDFMKHFRLPEGYVPHPDEELLNKAIDIALHRNVRFFNGSVLTEEIYYAQEDEDIIERWYNEGVGAFEMEAAALYANAEKKKKKALSMFTISNDIRTGEEMDPLERKSSLHEMVEVALLTAIS